MMAKLKESWYHARQEDDHHKSIVQQVLVRCTEFLRRIIAPVEGQGGVILVLWIPSLPLLSTRRLHLVSLSDARGRREEQEEAVQLGVRRATASTTGGTRMDTRRCGSQLCEGFSFRAHAPRQGACENLGCSPLVAGQLDVLPLGDHVVQPVQGSRSSNSSSSSTRSDNNGELAGCPFPDDDREALRGYPRFILQCSQHPKCTASRTISEQHSRHLEQYELAVCARLGVSAHFKSEHKGRAQESNLGVEPARVA